MGAVELVIGQSVRQNMAVAGSYAFDRPLACTTNEQVVHAAARVLEITTLQLLVHCAASGCQLQLFEAQASQHFAEIKHLLAAEQGELGRQWLTSREACSGLIAINERVMARASLLAAARQPSIMAYNAGRRTPEPLIFVVLAGLEALALHDPMVLTTVQHLAQQGPRCGVVLLLLHDLAATRTAPLQAAQRKALYTALGAIVPNAFGVDFSGTPPRPYNLGEPYQRFTVDFGYKPEITTKMLHGLTERILQARQAKVIANPHKDFLNIKIGEAQANNAYFALGHASYAFNALISGGSGSGKTTFVQNLVLSICEQYTPAQIELTLVDYGTVSFGPYRNVAHVQTVFNTPRDGERLARLFTALLDELHRRKDAFKTCGELYDLTVDNLTTYTQLSGVALPIWLTVIDEFGSLINNENMATAQVNGRTMRVNAYAEQAINLLVREGRKVGMHLVLITQSFAKIDRLPQDLKSNPHLAVALKAQEARDSQAIFNSENDAAHRIAPFQAVLNRHAGQPKQNIMVDLNYVSEAEIAQRQASLRKQWPRVTASTLNLWLDTASPDTLTASKITNASTDDEPSWLRKSAVSTGTQLQPKA